jgi:hypothetical protein
MMIGLSAVVVPALRSALLAVQHVLRVALHAGKPVVV